MVTQDRLLVGAHKWALRASGLAVEIFCKDPEAKGLPVATGKRGVRKMAPGEAKGRSSHGGRNAKGERPGRLSKESTWLAPRRIKAGAKYLPLEF